MPTRLPRHACPKLCEIDWEQRIAALPDTAPPKWMVTNIMAIREDTDRILQLIEQDRGQP